jgi:GT2 family glycosyltransferase
MEELPTGSTRDRLAIIIVSHNSARWLAACLSSVYENAGNLELDVVVVDSGSTDDTTELVRREFPGARVIAVPNRGFAAANNRGLEIVDAEWILFLNPDTRILSGSLEDLVSVLRARPEIGLAGVRQIDEKGVMDPTMRRFPNAVRSLSVSLGGERLPFSAPWLGERVLNLDLYDREHRCDWTVGSFMLVRRAAFDDVGPMDERFFLYCEETDYCLRVHRAGWDVVHLPQMTILHQSSTTGSDERLNAQMAFARRQYMMKHFSRPHRIAATTAIGLGYALRAVKPSRAPDARRRRASARTALATLVGLAPPPFGDPSTGAFRGTAETAAGPPGP